MQTLAWLVSKAPDRLKGVSKCFGSEFGSKRAENGLELFKYDVEIARTPDDRRQELVRLLRRFEWLQIASNGSVTAENCYGRRDSRRMKRSVSVRTWKARNGLDRSCR
jgi:hypothetical protein